jgi:hypothetical protein
VKWVRQVMWVVMLSVARVRKFVVENESSGVFVLGVCCLVIEVGIPRC